MTPETQLAITLYRLAHGCSLMTLEDLFGWSILSCAKTFNNVCRVLVSRLYDRCVRLPETDEEWMDELKGFTENYEFPCVGAWDGFHIYISSKLKNYFSFKKRYTMKNMGLIGYNKCFLYAAVGAPGSTLDARLLRCTTLYRDILAGGAIPDHQITLGDFGNIPLVTIGDNTFPKFSWLLKSYDEKMTEQQQCNFNKRLWKTENAYGMLKTEKGKRLWYAERAVENLIQKTEMRNFNLRYVVMVCWYVCCILLVGMLVPTNCMLVGMLYTVAQPMHRMEPPLPAKMKIGSRKPCVTK